MSNILGNLKGFFKTTRDKSIYVKAWDSLIIISSVAVSRLYCMPFCYHGKALLVYLIFKATEDGPTLNISTYSKHVASIEGMAMISGII